MKRLPLLLTILLVILVAGYLIFVAGGAEPTVGSQVLAGGTPPAGFALATGPAPLDFPAAHGAHPEYQTEWWYYTGNLETEDGRHFGYQLTFFRRGLVPPAEAPTRESQWATTQIYSAHFALTDVGANQFYSFEQVERGAMDLAGTQLDPYQVWINNWSVEQTGEDTYHLYASRDDVILDLDLEEVKAPVLHGDDGYMPSGPGVGDASYYYSQTRLESAGTIQASGKTYSVEGYSWKDHQYGTTGLTAEQVGWDWFSFQLSDGSEVMVYQLRQVDGSVDPFSRGTFVEVDGTVSDLDPEDFVIEVENTWRSPRTQALYPARWTVSFPSLELVLYIVPYMADQELSVSTTYWEGAVRIIGERGEESLTGAGYVELTGYAP
jgi:predicted secreted hydrolase